MVCLALLCSGCLSQRTVWLKGNGHVTGIGTVDGLVVKETIKATKDSAGKIVSTETEVEFNPDGTLKKITRRQLPIK